MDTDGWMDGKVVILIHSWPPLIYTMSTGQCVQTHTPPLNVHNGIGTEKMGKGDEGIGGYGTERNRTKRSSSSMELRLGRKGVLIIILAGVAWAVASVGGSLLYL